MQSPGAILKKVVLKNFAKFTGKYLCQENIFFNKVVLIMFPGEFCEIFKNTFF